MVTELKGTSIRGASWAATRTWGSLHHMAGVKGLYRAGLGGGRHDPP